MIKIPEKFERKQRPRYQSLGETKWKHFLIATDNTPFFLDRDWYAKLFYVILRICRTLSISSRLISGAKVFHVHFWNFRLFTTFLNSHFVLSVKLHSFKVWNHFYEEFLTVLRRITSGDQIKALFPREQRNSRLNHNDCQQSMQITLKWRLNSDRFRCSTTKNCECDEITKLVQFLILR